MTLCDFLGKVTGFNQWPSLFGTVRLCLSHLATVVQLLTCVMLQLLHHLCTATCNFIAVMEYVGQGRFLVTCNLGHTCCILLSS